jgi:hypothetical protein
MPSLAACTPQLVAALQNGDFEAQALAYDLLGLLPPHALAPYAPTLLRQLVTSEANAASISVLSKLDLSANPETQAALWEALLSDSWTVRHNAISDREATHGIAGRARASASPVLADHLGA